jgi:ribosome biogenesis GTPase
LSSPLASSLTSLGWDEHRAAELAATDPSLVPARVARVDRGALDLLTEHGPLRTDATAATRTDATVGDWVGIDADGGVVVMLRRRTALLRARSSGLSAAQALAANVDSVLVVVPAFPEPRVGMVERMVALVWDSGATPVVVVTKADLSPDPHGVTADIAATAPGAESLLVSVMTGEGLDALAALDVPGRTLALLGRSGAGKSTLANALLGEELLEVGEVRSDGKGRHTTTYRQLLRLPGGGVLVDTPGLRGVGLWIDGDGIDKTFPDVEELVSQCWFTDCGHETEPGCAVRAAIDDGSLDERRLTSWRKLQREAEWIAARSDHRLAAARRRVWAQRTKAARPPRPSR